MSLQKFSDYFTYETKELTGNHLVFKKCVILKTLSINIPKGKQLEQITLDLDSGTLQGLTDGAIGINTSIIEINTGDDYVKNIKFMNEMNGGDNDSCYCFYCHQYLFSDCPGNNEMGCGYCPAWFCEDCASNHNITGENCCVTSQCPVCEFKKCTGEGEN